MYPSCAVDSLFWGEWKEPVLLKPTWDFASVHLEPQGDAGLPGVGSDPEVSCQRGLGERGFGYIGRVVVTLENLTNEEQTH